MQTYTRLLTASIAFSAALAGSARADSILDRIAAEVLAAKFGIKTAEVARVRTASGLSMFDVAPIFSASSYGRTRADTVWQLRRQGLGWGQVAHRIGMHPGTFNKLRVAGAFDSGRIWSRTLGSRFAVPESRVRAVLGRGASPQDSIAAILIAKATHRSPQAVFDEYRGGRDWERIRIKYKVDFGNWRKVAKNPPPHRQIAQSSPRGKTKVHPIKPRG